MRHIVHLFVYKILQKVCRKKTKKSSNIMYKIAQQRYWRMNTHSSYQLITEIWSVPRQMRKKGKQIVCQREIIQIFMLTHTHTHMQNALEINERTKNQSKSRMNSTYQMTSYFQSDNTGFIRVGAGQPLIPSKVNSRVAFLLAKEIKRFSRCYVL